MIKSLGWVPQCAVVHDKLQQRGMILLFGNNENNEMRNSQYPLGRKSADRTHRHLVVVHLVVTTQLWCSWYTWYSTHDHEAEWRDPTPPEVAKIEFGQELQTAKSQSLQSRAGPTLFGAKHWKFLTKSVKNCPKMAFSGYFEVSPPDIGCETVNPAGFVFLASSFFFFGLFMGYLSGSNRQPPPHLSFHFYILGKLYGY